MKGSWLKNIFGATSSEHTIPARPAYLRRIEDNKRFNRCPDGIYENLQDHERIPMPMASDIIQSKIPGFIVSSDEAPDFHDPAFRGSDFIVFGK